MHILIDGRMISNTGIGRWLQNVVIHLNGLASDHNITVMVNRNSQTVRSFGLPTRKLRFSAPSYSIREQVFLPLELGSDQPDVVHYPNFNMPLMSRIPAVLTLCDLIYYRFRRACPSWIGYTYAKVMIPAAVRKARRMITISEYSKNDLIKYLGCSPSKISVVYPGIDPGMFRSNYDPQDVALATSKLGIRKPYIFYTGNHEPRKNLLLLVEAYRRLGRNSAYQLVLGGRIDARQHALYESVRDLVAKRDVILCGEIPEPDLPLLYAGAELFVFPSTYEGFGLQPLEAMAAGVPVICSSATSLPEVVGDAALTFAPDDIEALVSAMKDILESKLLASELRDKGRARSQCFSWDVAAKQIMNIYEDVAAAS